MTIRALVGTGNTSVPIYAFGSLVLFVGAILALDLSGHASDSPTFVALIISTIPSIIAALFSEKASRDIRNGVVQDKAQQGAQNAMNDPDTVNTLVSMLEHHLEEKEK